MYKRQILDTVQLEIHQAALREQSPKRLILAPGNYGLDYLCLLYTSFCFVRAGGNAVRQNGAALRLCRASPRFSLNL